MTDVRAKILFEINDLAEGNGPEITDNTPLLGDGSVLDSMKVVSLCIALEDLAADNGFEFDWTSDAAMSRSRSMFRTAGSLADEFFAQMNAKR